MLIGLCGRPQSGKSEVRNILCRFGYASVNTKLPIAQACSALTLIDDWRFLSQEGKAELYKGIPLRTIMGKVQDAMEEMFGDYQTIERALQNTPSYDYMVVDSLRKTQPDHFPGTIVEVISTRSVDTGNPFDIYSRNRIDYTLENNGNFGDLERQVLKMLEELGVRI